MKKSILTAMLAASYMLSGCGSTTEDKGENNHHFIEKRVIVSSNIDKESKNYFGVLSSATVNIYALGEGDKKLLFSEKTTSGYTKDEIGNFDAHLSELEIHKFYLYELSGGKNWDVDEDGVIDEKSTINNTIYRTINRGSKKHLSWWSDKSRDEKSKTTIE